MKSSTLKLLRSIIGKINKEIDANPYGFSEESVTSKISEQVESRGFKLKEFEILLNLFKNGDVDLRDLFSEIEEIDERERFLNKLSVSVLEETKKLRIERTKYSESKVDTNLLTHSIFSVGGSLKRKEQAKKEGYIKLDKSGFRRLTYENDQGHLLTTKDAKVLFGLFALWEDQGRGEYVEFSYYQLLKKLNNEIGGKQYAMLEDSLNKLRNTSVVLREAYDLESKNRVITERFKLIISDRFTIDTDKQGRVTLKLFEVQFSPYLHRSFKDGYYSLVNLAILNELESQAAQAMYMLLCGMLNDEDNRTVYSSGSNLFEIPLDKLYNALLLENVPKKNRLSIQNALEELFNIELINRFEFLKEGRRYAKVLIEPSEWLLEMLEKAPSLNGKNSVGQLTLDID